MDLRTRAKRFTLFAVILVSGAATSSCAGLNYREKEQVAQLTEIGIDPTDKGNNSGWVAGPLNIIPGAGNFYLATGTGESNQVVYGVLNIIPGWLVWPFTCLWSVPQAAVDAHNINKRQTVEYYFNTERGRQEMVQIRNSLAARAGSSPYANFVATPVPAPAFVPAPAPAPAAPQPQRRFWLTLEGKSVLKTEAEARLYPPNTPAMPEGQMAGWSTVGALLPPAAR